MRIQKSKRDGILFFDFVDLKLIFLCLFIIIGGVIGYLTQRTVSADSKTELCEYLKQYVAEYSNDIAPVSFLKVLMIYFRYPLLSFIFGFCTVGVYLLPLLCMIQGFSLSFSICCFASAMGRAGVYLAFSAFGLRVLVTLPCLLLLSSQAFDNARRLRDQTHKRNRIKRNATYLVLPGICSLLLLLGAVLELSLLPHLFQWVFEKIM